MDYSVTGASVPTPTSLQNDMGRQGRHRTIPQAFNQQFRWLVPCNYTVENSKWEKMNEFGLTNHLKVKRLILK